MKAAPFWIIFAAAAAGCAEANLATRYVGNEHSSVPVSIAVFEISELRGYEDKRYPGKIYVEPNPKKKLGLAFAGRQAQWVAMLSQIEPIYRDAALQALKARGHSECTASQHAPLPAQFGIEFEYHCES